MGPWSNAGVSLWSSVRWVTVRPRFPFRPPCKWKMPFSLHRRVVIWGSGWSLWRWPPLCLPVQWVGHCWLRHVLEASVKLEPGPPLYQARHLCASVFSPQKHVSYSRLRFTLWSWGSDSPTDWKSLRELSAHWQKCKVAWRLCAGRHLSSLFFLQSHHQLCSLKSLFEKYNTVR